MGKRLRAIGADWNPAISPKGKIVFSEIGVEPHMISQSDPIRRIVEDYHLALDLRHHGGVAAGQAVEALERLLGMPWKQGKAKAAREAEQKEPKR